MRVALPPKWPLVLAERLMPVPVWPMFLLPMGLLLAVWLWMLPALWLPLWPVWLVTFTVTRVELLVWPGLVPVRTMVPVR